MTALVNSELVTELGTFFLTRDSWRTWTPTVTQSSGVTITVAYARYVVLAQTVILQADLIVTGSGTGGNAIVIGGIPVAPAHTGAFFPIGAAVINNFGTASYNCAVVPVGANDFRLLGYNTAGYVGVSPNFALAPSDAIAFTAMYER